MRPGRLDRWVLCPLPDQSDRHAILGALTRDVPLAEDVRLDELAARSEGLTGADLKALVADAQLATAHCMLQSREGQAGSVEGMSVTMGQLSRALQELRPSVSRVVRE